MVRTGGEGTTVYLPGGQELHVASDGLATATRYYGFAGQTVAVRSDRGLGGVSSLVCDPHGTPVASVPNTNWGPKSVQKMYTDPYGGARGPSDAATVPGDMGFLGKNRDESTGLTMVGARYYDESIGRFISVDPALVLSDPGQWNAYGYGANNPVNETDPTGLGMLKPLNPGLIDPGPGDSKEEEETVSVDPPAEDDFLTDFTQGGDRLRRRDGHRDRRAR